jgi:hypothetical protein
MAIVNHPPWDVYQSGTDWWYFEKYTDGIKLGTFERPDCNVINLRQVVAHYKKTLQPTETKEAQAKTNTNDMPSSNEPSAP